MQKRPPVSWIFLSFLFDWVNIRGIMPYRMKHQKVDYNQDEPSI